MNGWRLATLALVLSLPVLAICQTITGGAFLASQSKHFPCSPVLEFYRQKKGPVFHAVLWSSFGNKTKCLRQILALKKKVTLEIYLSNEACRRSRTCERSDFLPWIDVFTYNRKLEEKCQDVKRKVRKKAAEIRRFCEANKAHCLLALGLESNYTYEAARTIRQAVLSAGWKRSALVYNPGSGYRGSIGAFIEYHRLQRIEARDAARSIVSLDGNHLDICEGRSAFNKVSSAQLRAWASRNPVRYFGAWCPMWQGSGQRNVSRVNRSIAVTWGELSKFLELFGGI